jgi:hypothetical protein
MAVTVTRITPGGFIGLLLGPYLPDGWIIQNLEDSAVGTAFAAGERREVSITVPGLVADEHIICVPEYIPLNPYIQFVSARAYADGELRTVWTNVSTSAQTETYDGISLWLVRIKAS